VQPGPDADSRELTEQLLRVPEQNARGAGPRMLGVAVSRFHNGLARALNGDEIADNLGIPDDLWKYSLYPVRAVITPLERIRRIVPGVSRVISSVSNQVIRRDLDRILRGQEPSFS